MNPAGNISLPSRYAGRHHMWWLCGLLLITLFGVLFSNDVGQAVGTYLPETVPNPSTYNKKASGYSGVWELAEKLRIPVHRWQASYRLLENQDVHGTLVVLSPWDPPTAGEMEMLAQWIAKGNDLILIDDFSMSSSRQMLQMLSLQSNSLIVARTFKGKVDSSYPESALVGEITGKIDHSIEGGATVCSDHKYVCFAQVEIGKGRCLVGTLPDFCSNGNLNDPAYKSNFQFLANWLQTSKQPIYFDEKCHGYSSGNNAVFFILRSPVGYIILQLLILLAVAFLSLNQRFGPRVHVCAARKISNLEFINGLAGGYQRARARDTAWAMIFMPFRARLCKLVGVAPHEPTEALAAAWAEHSGQNREQLESFLQRAERALNTRKLDDAELSKLIADCDRFAASAPQLASTARVLGA